MAKAIKTTGKNAKASKKIERSYDLTATELFAVKKLAKEQKTAAILLIHRAASSYGAIVHALYAAKGKAISFAELRKAVAQTMGKEAWSSYINRKPRNKTTALDANGRLAQSAYVLTRSDYGRSIVQCGGRIEITKDKKGQKFYALLMK